MDLLHHINAVLEHRLEVLGDSPVTISTLLDTIARAKTRKSKYDQTPFIHWSEHHKQMNRLKPDQLTQALYEIEREKEEFDLDAANINMKDHFNNEPTTSARIEIVDVGDKITKEQLIEQYHQLYPNDLFYTYTDFITDKYVNLFNRLK